MKRKGDELAKPTAFTKIYAGSLAAFAAVTHRHSPSERGTSPQILHEPSIDSNNIIDRGDLIKLA